MANSMFDQFKVLLTQLVDDPDVIRKNSLLSNATYRADLKSRISAMTADVSLLLDYANALTPTLGMLTKSPSTRQLQFTPKGFGTYLSAFREGTLDQPGHITVLDGVGNDPRYVIADAASGVVVANSELEVLSRFPHFGPIALEEYDDPSATVVWEQGGVKYIAIACYSHHIVQIYLWEEPYTWIATIGVLDTPGSIAGYCNNPRGLAVDATNMRLYIANEFGTPAGATLNRGYVSVYDLSTISAPVESAVPWYHDKTGSLLDGEVSYPRSLTFDASSNMLWVSNGPEFNEVGAFDVTAAVPNTLKRFIEPAGPGYTLRSPTQIYIYSMLGGYKHIFVGNGDTGVVEEYDYVNLTHLNSYGYRASEDDLNGYSRLSPAIYGAIGFPTAVAVDRIFLDGQDIDVLLVGDRLNKRLHRFNLDAYSQENWVNFAVLEFQVPISVYGWTINGDVPLDMVTVYYRYSETEEFRELPQETGIPASSSLQFRVAVKLLPNKFIKNWFIRHLRIHAVQV